MQIYSEATPHRHVQQRINIEERALQTQARYRTFRHTYRVYWVFFFFFFFFNNTSARKNREAHRYRIPRGASIFIHEFYFPLSANFLRSPLAFHDRTETRKLCYKLVARFFPPSLYWQTERIFFFRSFERLGGNNAFNLPAFRNALSLCTRVIRVEEGKKKGKKRERKIVKYFLTKALNADYRCWTEIATWDV